MSDYILGIESSCDDTSAAVIRDGLLLSNVIASQQVHKDFGGVVPELASRAHEKNIVPVVSQALSKAGIRPSDLSAIAFTRGPGLLGSLLVGTSFAKALSLSLDIPMVMVNHLQGHILAGFVQEEGKEFNPPSFPYLCLLVSGGNSQIVRVDSPLEFEMPHIPGLDYSFSGIKTSLLYFVRDEIKKDPDFLEKNKEDICASFQKTLIDILMDKLVKAARQTGIKEITIGGGVSANSALRAAVVAEGKKRGWKTHLPEFKFTTDNAAMIAVAGWFRWKNGESTPLDVAPVSRMADY